MMDILNVTGIIISHLWQIIKFLFLLSVEFPVIGIFIFLIFIVYLGAASFVLFDPKPIDLPEFKNERSYKKFCKKYGLEYKDGDF